MDNKKIDSKLYQDYVSGNLDLNTRFQLEKKALDDEFLFEALEGYAYAEEADVQNVLLSFKVVSGASRDGAVIKRLTPYRWVAGVAASILLVSAIAYFMYDTASINESSQSAQIVENNIDPFGDSVLENENEKTESDNLTKSDIQENREKELPVIEKEEEIVEPPVINKPNRKIDPTINETGLTGAANRKNTVSGPELIEVKPDVKKEIPKESKGQSTEQSIAVKGEIKPSSAIQFSKASPDMDSENLLDEQSSNALNTFIMDRFEAKNTVDSLNLPFRAILEIDENVTVTKTIFLNGCKACFEVVEDEFTNYQFTNLPAQKLGKRLIFSYKSK